MAASPSPGNAESSDPAALAPGRDDDPDQGKSSPKTVWADLPQEFDEDFLRGLTVRQILDISMHGDNHLSEAQMEAFRADREQQKAVLGPKVQETVSRLQKLAMTGHASALSERMNQLAKAASLQSSASSHLLKLVNEAKIDLPTVTVPAPIPLDDHFEAVAQAREKTRAEQQERERQRVNREEAMVELLAATSSATSALVTNAVSQERRLESQAILTGVLSFAVVFDVVNGSFDDHTWWTTLISTGVGLLALGLSTGLGQLWVNRRSQ